MMKLTKLTGDEAILAELGRRIARHRVRLQLTQARLANEAGVGKRTVERLENGESTQLLTLIRVFRVLGLLPNLDAMVPEPGIDPLEALKHKGGMRLRASAPREDEHAGPWEWQDEP